MRKKKRLRLRSRSRFDNFRHTLKQLIDGTSLGDAVVHKDHNKELALNSMSEQVPHNMVPALLVHNKVAALLAHSKALALLVHSKALASLVHSKVVALELGSMKVLERSSNRCLGCA